MLDVRIHSDGQASKYEALQYLTYKHLMFLDVAAGPFSNYCSCWQYIQGPDILIPASKSLRGIHMAPNFLQALQYMAS